MIIFLRAVGIMPVLPAFVIIYTVLPAFKAFINNHCPEAEDVVLRFANRASKMAAFINSLSKYNFRAFNAYAFHVTIHLVLINPSKSIYAYTNQ